MTVAFLIYTLYTIQSGASIQAFLYTNTSPSERKPPYSLASFMLAYTMSSSPASSSPLRIAILECDTPIGKTKEKYGGYGNLFKELLHNGAKEVREKDGVEVPELDVRKYDVVNEEVYPKLEDVDAVLLSGSRECCPSFVCGCGRLGRERTRGLM